MTPDGTCTWTDPTGHRTVTHPGSRTLFPDLCAPTAPLTVTGASPQKHTAALTMPTRRVTRTHARENRINAERAANAQWARRHIASCIPPF